jgi:esterase FrsA
MNDVGEMKQFAAAHAGALNIHHSPELLARIRTGDEGAPGSWHGSGARRPTRSCGRAPPQRLPALHPGPVPLYGCPYAAGGIDTKRARVRPLAAGRNRYPASRRQPSRRPGPLLDGRTVSGPALPLLLVMGGMEQWAPILAQAGRLGMAGVVTEMPSVGENTLRYDAESWRMLSGVLDAVGDRAPPQCPRRPWLEKLVIRSREALCASGRKAYNHRYCSGPRQLHSHGVAHVAVGPGFLNAFIDLRRK